jgi:hypothetical protein
MTMPDEAGPQHWEYLTIPESENGRLGELGEQGWELVATGGGPDERTLYLKRPALSFRERVTLAQRRHYYQSRGLGAALDSEDRP